MSGHPGRSRRWTLLLDLLFFRAVALALLLHETVLTASADWEIVVAGLCMFFMPEAVRGTASPPIAAMIRLLGKREN